MKINPVLLIIAIAIAGLSAFGFYAANSGEAYYWLITVGSGLSLFFPLSGLLALSFEGRGGSVNIKVVSVLFFIALLVEQLIFNFTGVKLAPYVIITGILLLIYILTAYALSKAVK
jgi:hypothetical protein